MQRAKHIKMTEREFKQRKRAEFQKFKKALAQFRIGSAYLPAQAYSYFEALSLQMEAIEEHCQPWWRKA